jgi:hypothetical protein
MAAKPFTWLFWCAGFGTALTTSVFGQPPVGLTVYLVVATIGECLLLTSIFYLDEM